MNGVLQLSLLPKLFYGESIIVLFAEEFAGDKAKALQIRNELLAELPEGERLRAHVYASLGDALDRAEGNVAEEAAYYEKALEIVPNLYSLKIWLRFISVTRN